MKTRDSAEEQSWLTKLMIAAGCEASVVEDGVCSGLNRTAILFSILIQASEKSPQGIDIFKHILASISKYDAESIAAEIQMAEEGKHTTSNSNALFLLSIKPFFQLVCALQDEPLVSKNFPTEKIFSMLQAIPLISSYLPHQPDRLVTQSALLTGMYPYEELDLYFRSIYETYKEIDNQFELGSEKPPIILWLGNSTHFISIILNNSWTFINANDMEVVDTNVSKKEIANKTAEAFSEDEPVAFSTRLFCAPQDELFMKKFLAKLQTHPDWQKIHQITAKKLRMKDSSGITWAHLCALENDATCLQELIKKGANLNKGDEENYTLAHLAAGENHVEIIELLYQNYAKLNCPNMHEGNTPLHLATAEGHVEAVKKLLKFGAKPGVKNDALQTPADLIRHSPMSTSMLLTLFKTYAREELNSDPDSVDSMTCENSTGSPMTCGENTENIFSPTQTVSDECFSPDHQSIDIFATGSSQTAFDIDYEDNNDDFEETVSSPKNPTLGSSITLRFAQPQLDSSANETTIFTPNMKK